MRRDPRERDVDEREDPVAGLERDALEGRRRPNRSDEARGRAGEAHHLVDHRVMFVAAGLVVRKAFDDVAPTRFRLVRAQCGVRVSIFRARCGKCRAIGQRFPTISTSALVRLEQYVSGIDIIFGPAEYLENPLERRREPAQAERRRRLRPGHRPVHHGQRLARCPARGEPDRSGTVGDRSEDVPEERMHQRDEARRRAIVSPCPDPLSGCRQVAQQDQKPRERRRALRAGQSDNLPGHAIGDQIGIFANESTGPSFRRAFRIASTCRASRRAIRPIQSRYSAANWGVGPSGLRPRQSPRDAGEQQYLKPP